MSESIAIRKVHTKPGDLAELEWPLTFYAEIVIRCWRMITVFSIALTILVVGGCALMPPVNLGSAMIAIEPQVLEYATGGEGLVTTRYEQFMATQTTLLQADAILRPLAERYRLLEREQQLRRNWFWHYSREQELAIRNAPIVLKHLTIERQPNTYLLTINYRDKDPRVAAAVANAIADSYLWNTFETRTREAGRQPSSVERRLIDLRQKMESAHSALMAYQPDLGIADPERKESTSVAKSQMLNKESGIVGPDRTVRDALFHAAKDGSAPKVQISSQLNDVAEDLEKLRVAEASLAPVGVTFGDQHPTGRRAAEVDEASAVGNDMLLSISSRTDMDDRQTLVREPVLSATVAEYRQQIANISAPSVEYLQLRYQADEAERDYENLFAKIKQSGIKSELQNNVIRLANSARPAAKPVFPNWPAIIVCSLAFFAIACSAWTMWDELTDGTAKGIQAVEEALGIPVVCALPRVMDLYSRLALGPDGIRFAGNRWRSMECGFFDEGVRHLRGYLMFSARAGRPRSVLVTSAFPGEGKSTLGLALAMANAEQGRRTLLIDANLRQPAIEKLMRLNPDFGLPAVLGQSVQWRTATREVSTRPNLFILASGLPSLRALVLIGPQIRGILAEATKDFDLIVLDSPALLGCAETLELAAAAEATVLAVRSESTPMKAVQAAVETLRRVDAPIAGIVLNESAIAAGALSKAYASYYAVLGSALRK